MSLLIGFLTFLLVMNCLFLMLLILIQLPKKEAGAGIAFGGAATDALFGAGSGNALTKLTKYSGSIFVAMSVLLSMLNMQAARQGSRRLEQELSRQANSRATLPTPLPTNLTQTPVQGTSSNMSLQVAPAVPANSLLTTPSTTQPVKPVTGPAPAVQTPAPSAEAPVAATPAPATPAPANPAPAPANPTPANPAPAK